MQNNAMALPPAFMSIDATTVLAQPAHTQALHLVGSLGNTYEGIQQWQHDESVILGLGFESYKGHSLDMNTSVRYLPQISMPSHGEVLQLNQPQFRNLAYSYTIKNDLIFLDHTTTWTKHRLQPGFILGLGAALTTTENYHETPLNAHSSPSLDHFKESYTTQFVYEIGAVLDYKLDDIVIEAAYRLLNAGHAQLGLSPLQNTTEHLFTGPLRYNAVSLGVRYHHEF